MHYFHLGCPCSERIMKRSLQAAGLSVQPLSSALKSLRKTKAIPSASNQSPLLAESSLAGVVPFSSHGLALRGGEWTLEPSSVPSSVTDFLDDLGQIGSPFSAWLSSSAR